MSVNRSGRLRFANEIIHGGAEMVEIAGFIALIYVFTVRGHNVFERLE